MSGLSMTGQSPLILILKDTSTRSRLHKMISTAKVTKLKSQSFFLCQLNKVRTVYRVTFLLSELMIFFPEESSTSTRRTVHLGMSMCPTHVCVWVWQCLDYQWLVLKDTSTRSRLHKMISTTKVTKLLSFLSVISICSAWSYSLFCL